MSTRNPTHGTKVTDPNAPSSNEGAGAVASDSLAAESVRDDGGFSENKNSEPLGVSGSNSTFANQDTSGAVRLDAATDSEARQAKEDWAEEKRSPGSTSYPTAVGGQSKAHAGESTVNTGGSHVDVAPTYVNQYNDGGKPKGQNLKEGGFNDSKNASFNNEVGTKNDPARAALDKMQASNADAANTAGMPFQKATTDDNEYGTLDSETSA